MMMGRQPTCERVFREVFTPKAAMATTRTQRETNALLASCQKTGARHELDFMLTLISAVHRAIMTRNPDELL